jgi:NosR/NirI family transcriptional regulator, nitrous oxide reductase regulator
VDRSRLLIGLLTLAIGGLILSTTALAEVNIARPGTSTLPTELRCGDRDPCQQVLPGAVRFDKVLDKPYAVGFDPDGKPVGWVVLSNLVVDINGYSGKPLATLIGLDPQAAITGGKVVHHSEPILLVGIPESELDAFVDSYEGMTIGTRVVLGGDAGPDELSIDIVSGATVTVLAENRTILEAARAVAVDVGVLEPTPTTPGHFVEDEEPWTWAQMMKEEALGHLRVTHDQMDIAGGDEAFIDLYFGLAEAPHIGIPLMGQRTYDYMMGRIAEDERLLVVLGNGTSSFRGSGFVRGGLFDRIRLEQGLSVVMFRDLDYKRLGQPPVADAPHFGEVAVFITRDGGLDASRPFDFVFLGSAFDYEGGFSRTFNTFKSGWRAPKRVYHLDGPDPESLVWRQAWSAASGMVVLVTIYLLLVTGVFVFRKKVTASLPRLKRIHVAALSISFFGLGLGLSYQPSVTQLLTLVASAMGEWRWGLFLSEPFLFVSWIWIAGVTIVWGRGVFCGWVCPYGAMNELAFKLGRVVKLPEFELPDAVHDKARWIRYGVFGVLVGAFLVSPELGERLAEVEPFKSTFFVRPWAREWFLFGWWLLLAGVAFVWYRPFCRYLCPLGAALALPSSFRLSGPYRRDFCATGCKICPRGCEPKAIRKDGSIDSRECLNCWECEANYNDDEVCPPLVQIRRRALKAEAGKGTA